MVAPGKTLKYKLLAFLELHLWTDKRSHYQTYDQTNVVSVAEEVPFDVLGIAGPRVRAVL